MQCYFPIAPLIIVIARLIINAMQQKSVATGDAVESSTGDELTPLKGKSQGNMLSRD